MKNLLILCLITGIIASSLNANIIDESKTDIYYGNGVWNLQFTKTKCKKQDAAECSQRYLDRLLRKEIIKNDPKLKTRYGKVKLSYNYGKGKFADLLELFYQLKEAGQISERTFFATVDELVAKSLADIKDGVELEEMRQIVIDAIVKTEQENIDTMQQKYYNESFKYSHRVLLVSHSQGNMFANRIYDTINSAGYKSYFANIQVASPASSIHAPKGEYVTGFFDPLINTIPESMEYNAVLAPAGHAFVSTYLDTLDPRTRIVKGIKKLLLQLDDVKETLSQWETKSEISEKGTKEYRITVKHIFDDGVLDIDDEVYPFDTKDGKIYQAPDTSGTPHYVKASFGGEKILDAELDSDLWEAEDNQFYKLQGTDPAEYIEGEKTCKDPSLFEIISHENKYTENWRVTVKNKETNETQPNVYPFNLKGSLYKLGNSDEWVLASCGGINIVSVWNGQEEDEIYKLKETSEIINIFYVLKGEMDASIDWSTPMIGRCPCGHCYSEELDDDTKYALFWGDAGCYLIGDNGGSGEIPSDMIIGYIGTAKQAMLSKISNLNVINIDFNVITGWSPDHTYFDGVSITMKYDYIK